MRPHSVGWHHMVRLYDSTQWKHLRDAKRRASPMCEPCAKAGIVRAAQLVDHIVPVRAGGQPLPPLEGLRSMCWPCHQRKGASVDKGHTIPRHVQGFDADGNPLDGDDPWHGDATPAPTSTSHKQHPVSLSLIEGGGASDHQKCARPSPAADLNVDLFFPRRGNISDLFLKYEDES